ncbi:hypothetical protein Sango_0337400 [Sesamum angolense]|uniref:DUF4220 domain-containing protein n=1 Tax=Sesamum angolense TaxID=2727404 RepID=A0AAE1XA76_9LAMI|nr:hypothetical protein Sango_0337400 [Sesamum angolense]
MTARNVGPSDELMWFWAQFFLQHLGGPDTITAYSLEDNELWLRHLVGLVIQTGLAFYILLVALPGSSWLPVLSILIFVAGLIKYGERLFALFASNSENFRDSMVTEPDPGPNYAKFMEEFTLKKAEGFYVEAAECLFADAILSFQDRDNSQHYFQNLSPEQAFDVVEVELGFVFDELYTKASVVYKAGGIVLRTITFSVTFFALMAFLFLCEKSAYKKRDLLITYMLLVVAICLEIELARINERNPTALWNRSGSFTLENYGNLHLDWTQVVEFDQRILLWHIATDICYSMEWGDNEESNSTERKQRSDHSKHISDYMLYLLIACPFMLPIGIGMIRFRDTCAEAKEFLEERNVGSCKTTACKKLLQVNTEIRQLK